MISVTVKFVNAKCHLEVKFVNSKCHLEASCIYYVFICVGELHIMIIFNPFI